MLTMYGIKNCDTIKKARQWLNDHQREYRFHDFRVDSLDAALLQSWVKELGWETLLNKRGTTWRQLPENVRDNINETSAISLMLENPAIIKRPIIDNGKKRFVGFSAEDYSKV